MLLDEVGTGTDPAEGAALGIALLRALAAGGARGAAVTVATTHHRCVSTPSAGRCSSLSTVMNLNCHERAPLWSVKCVGCAARQPLLLPPTTGACLVDVFSPFICFPEGCPPIPERRCPFLKDS